ncbi:hypothetical protein [Rhodobacter capsulatus]|uniref:hypothetical protein n=1 Tax=Rhodobacter capsulatus TaxID=1061 RepID=UPI004024B416
MTEPKYAAGPADFLTLAEVQAMTGLEFMQAMLAGQVPTTTFARGCNYQVTRVEPGLVEVTGTPGHEHTNAFGGVHGGWYGGVAGYGADLCGDHRAQTRAVSDDDGVQGQHAAGDPRRGPRSAPWAGSSMSGGQRASRGARSSASLTARPMPLARRPV